MTLQQWLDRKKPGKKPRKRIPHVSRRQQLRNAEYHRAVAAWKPLHPTCEVGPIIKAAGFKVRCNRVTTHPHHVKGRLGKNLCDQTTWLASCDGECHPFWIHQAHVEEAKKLGLLQ